MTQAKRAMEDAQMEEGDEQFLLERFNQAAAQAKEWVERVEYHVKRGRINIGMSAIAPTRRRLDWMEQDLKELIQLKQEKQ